jgi:pentatricopeptide repeat protein
MWLSVVVLLVAPLLPLRLVMQELLGELLGWGVPPALAHYEHVLEGHALHRDSTAAEAVLDRISAAGHAPLLRTYNRALHGVGKCGDLAAADRIYRRMRAQSVRPDQQTMRALFMCVRMHASNVRVTTARRMAACRPGDRCGNRGGGACAAQQSHTTGHAAACTALHTPTAHMFATLS